MNVENQLKEEILSRYKSVRAFTQMNDLPYSTVDSIFKRGLSNAGVATIIKIFNALDLDIESIQEGCLIHKKQEIVTSLSEKAQKIAADYDSLDAHGQRMVRLVTDEEKNRMEAEAARKERDTMEAGMLAPPAPTPEEEAKAEAESFYQEVLQEKKIQAELSASPSTNGTGEKMA